MSELYVVSRSNYFRVKDNEVFKKTMKEALGDGYVWEASDGKVSFGAYDDVSMFYNYYGNGEHEALDLLLQPMMEDDAVCVVSEISHMIQTHVAASRCVITKTSSSWDVILDSNDDSQGGLTAETLHKKNEKPEVTIPDGRRIRA